MLLNLVGPCFDPLQFVDQTISTRSSDRRAECAEGCDRAFGLE